MEFAEHLLYLMVNGQSRSTMQRKMFLDMSFVRDFCRMVLLECANNYFEQVNSEQIEKDAERFADTTPGARSWGWRTGGGVGPPGGQIGVRLLCGEVGVC